MNMRLFAILMLALPCLADEGDVLIQIDGYGFAKVTYNDLQDTMDPTRLPPEKMTLFLRDEPVPIMPIGCGDGTFDPGDGFFFFAGATDSPYSVTNVYRLVEASDEAVFLEAPSRPEGLVREIELESSERIFRRSRASFSSAGSEVTRSFFAPANEYRIEIEAEEPVSGTVVLETPAGERKIDVTRGKVVFTYHAERDGLKRGGLWFRLVLPEGTTRYKGKITEIRERDNGVPVTMSLEGDRGMLVIEDFPREHYFAYRINDGKLLWTEVKAGGRLGVLIDEGENHAIFSSMEAMHHPTRIHRAGASDVVEDGFQACYLAIAPRAFLDGLAPLLAKRREELGTARAVAVEDLYDAYAQGNPDPEAIVDFMERLSAGSAPPPQYLLIAAPAWVKGNAGLSDPYTFSTYRFDTVMTLPPLEHAAEGEGWSVRVPVDSYFGDLDRDGVTEIAVGRIPCRSAGELAAVVEKILDYEENADLGPHCARAFLQAGLGRFDTRGSNKMMGAMLESMLERLANGLLERWVPPIFDVDVMFSASSSDFFYTPSKFRDGVVDRLNKGFFCAFYIGHGNKSNFDTFSWRDKKYETFLVDDAARVSIPAGRGPYFSLTCLTGTLAMRHGQRCLGAELFMNPSGPSAVVAGSGEVHEIPNFLVTVSVLKALFEERVPRIGDLLRAVKEYTPGQAQNEELEQLLSLLRSVMADKVPEQEQIRLGQVQYTLYGDPAMKIHYPSPGLELAEVVPGRAGGTMKVSGTVERIVEGSVWITVELPRDKTLERIRKPSNKLSDEEAEKVIEKNNRLANYRVVASVRLPVKEGRFSGEISLPETAPRGKVLVKAYAAGDGVDAVGIVETRITNPD
jgi:hypothetical protein